MPTPTWERLDPERRDRVLRAAMAEFGRYGFSGGSLNTIAREAGVAKGSLFQYFADKLDFFATVCDEVSRRIRDEIEPRLAELAPGRGIFDFFEDALDLWIDYFAAHPTERAVTAATMLELDTAARSAVRGVVHRHYLEVLRPLVAAAKARGDLREDTDLDALLAWLLLLLPHLALAPYIEGLDPVLGLYGSSPEELKSQVRRLVATLRVAYGRERT
ncbi:TetR/AcrR family transcriptional regulator [Carbonactinospora thermoautotrophica]|uniref:Transcriptional regulator n=1 Tax=Carbonactinospora thermoautotrophica TaxID=1469144 RepID=A0A132N4C0_9ACTN|nr:TetR/AcrR family transcriptional regulator [Carbonactinospora thermoautotrophica]KWW99297.1 Transcriptional regulator [Carbonactinospora thermoautotrophica]KWX04943.1 TetR family transcriptional regulator [Carbonactinospora thermoautotrophica]KWX08954.1 TetR family transcriptional regulator [Carbonactinospora thermoautotrophica]MCX9192570.1 TetR/AcrR family transcriptional regulator [Carbonactinospora thermoautotrophica]